MNVQEVIDFKLAEREAKERTGWYCSDFGKCPVGLWMERKGFQKTSPFDARLIRVFKMGDLVEKFVIESLGEEVMETQGSIEIPEVSVRGRFDVLTREPRLLEVKSMHSNGFHWRMKAGFQPLPQHKAQVMMYLHVLKEKYPDLKADLVYVSKDDGLIQQIPIYYDPKLMAKILEFFGMLETCWKEDKLPPLPESKEFDEVKGKWSVNFTAKSCNYHGVCTGDKNWLMRAESEVEELNKGLKKKK
jgi:CRISPR/Cas system-associated exonuclease Cas4 (RecB family)